jgi:hypothetical protein
MTSLPEFEEVFREVKRAFREAGLMNERSNILTNCKITL